MLHCGDDSVVRIASAWSASFHATVREVDPDSWICSRSLTEERTQRKVSHASSPCSKFRRFLASVPQVSPYFTVIHKAWVLLSARAITSQSCSGRGRTLLWLLVLTSFWLPIWPSPFWWPAWGAEAEGAHLSCRCHCWTHPEVSWAYQRKTDEGGCPPNDPSKFCTDAFLWQHVDCLFPTPKYQEST